MGLRILSFTDYVENFVCVYRNYNASGLFRKTLIFARICIEISLIATYTSVWIHCYARNLNDMWLIYLTSFNSALVIFLAVYHSTKFQNFKNHLNFGKRYYSSDGNYQSYITMKQWVFIGLVFLLSIAKILIFIYQQILTYPSILARVPLFWHYFFELNTLMGELRYMIEYLTMYFVLYVMSEQIQFITRFIHRDTVQSDIDLEFQHDYLKNFINRITVPEIERWSMGYRHITLSCELFNSIFGLQLTVMLGTTTFYYIIILYIIASEGIAGNLTVVNISMYCASLAVLLCILYMLSRSAQQMQNSADILRRRMCKLLVLSVTNDEKHTAIKDLLRLFSTRPIRARAFGSINIDMTLIPTCISFFTTYTVIALQFNNIL